MQPANLISILVLVALGIGSGIWRARVTLNATPGLEVQSIFKRTPHLWGTVFIPLLLGGASLWVASDDELIWEMPFWLQLHYQEFIWGVILGLMNYLFAFSVTAYRRLQHPDRHRVLALAVVLTGIVGYVGFRSSHQEPVKLRPPRISADGVILQSSMSSCAAAASANIVREFGMEKSEADFAKLFHTSVEGTLPAQIADGFRQLGFKVTRRTVADRDVAAVCPPAILLVSGDTHAVALVAVTNGIAEILDPLSGRQRVKPANFTERWSGHALEIRPKD